MVIPALERFRTWKIRPPSSARFGRPMAERLTGDPTLVKERFLIPLPWWHLCHVQETVSGIFAIGFWHLCDSSPFYAHGVLVFPHPHGIQGTSVVPGLRRQTSNAPNRASNWKRRRTVSNSRENSAERPSKQVGSHRTTDAPVVVSRAAVSRATSEAMRYIPKQFES